jgi:hypothetical protein
MVLQVHTRYSKFQSNSSSFTSSCRPAYPTFHLITFNLDLILVIVYLVDELIITSAKADLNGANSWILSYGDFALLRVSIYCRYSWNADWPDSSSPPSTPIARR